MNWFKVTPRKMEFDPSVPCFMPSTTKTEPPMLINLDCFERVESDHHGCSLMPKTPENDRLYVREPFQFFQSALNVKRDGSLAAKLPTKELSEDTK